MTSDWRTGKSGGRPLPFVSSTDAARFSRFGDFLTMFPFALTGARIFKIVVSGLNDPDFVQTTGRQQRVEDVPDHCDKILSRCSQGRERRVTVQILMIKAFDDRIGDEAVKGIQVGYPLCRSGTNRHQDHIVMPVTVRIVTFAEGSPVFFRGEEIRVQPMGSAKSIASGHKYL